MVPFNGYRMNQNRPHDLKDLAALSLGQKSKGTPSFHIRGTVWTGSIIGEREFILVCKIRLWKKILLLSKNGTFI
jgi:hypothetical protein